MKDIENQFINKLEEKYSYIEYEDRTIGSNSLPSFLPYNLTTIPKSKYDNVVGQIHVKKS